MNNFKLFFCFLILCNLNFADENRIGSILKIETNNGQVSGFLKYEGKHFNEHLVILSVDIGSAMPSENLKLYKENGDQKFIEIFHIPLQNRKGFLCKNNAEKLEIYIVDNYENKNPKLFLIIDLKLLLLTNDIIMIKK